MGCQFLICFLSSTGTISDDLALTFNYAATRYLNLGKRVILLLTKLTLLSVVFICDRYFETRSIISNALAIQPLFSNHKIAQNFFGKTVQLIILENSALIADGILKQKIQIS